MEISMIFFVSWEAIGLFIFFALVFIGGSEAAFNIITFFLFVAKIIVIITGVVYIIACWMSKRLIITKVWNTICIVVIVYALFWGTGSFRQELIDTFNDQPLNYLITVILGGLEFLIYATSGAYAIVSMSSEDGDTPHISMISGLVFFAMLIQINENLLNNLINILGDTGMLCIKIILISAFLLTIIQKIWKHIQQKK